MSKVDGLLLGYAFYVCTKKNGLFRIACKDERNRAWGWVDSERWQSSAASLERDSVYCKCQYLFL